MSTHRHIAAMQDALAIEGWHPLAVAQQKRATSHESHKDGEMGDAM
jgi:hypothetical protein